MKKFELKNQAKVANINSFNKFKKYEISKSKQRNVKGGDDIIIEDFVDV